MNKTLRVVITVMTMRSTTVEKMMEQELFATMICKLQLQGLQTRILLIQIVSVLRIELEAAYWDHFGTGTTDFNDQLIIISKLA